MPVTVPPEQDNYWILGTEKGQQDERNRIALKMLQKQNADISEIADLLDLPIEAVQQLLEEARNN